MVQMVRSGDRPVLAAKAVRVGDFNGKTLSTIGSSLLTINPDHPQAAEVRNWWTSPLFPQNCNAFGAAEERAFYNKPETTKAIAFQSFYAFALQGQSLQSSIILGVQ